MSSVEIWVVQLIIKIIRSIAYVTQSQLICFNLWISWKKIMMETWLEHQFLAFLWQWRRFLWSLYGFRSNKQWNKTATYDIGARAHWPHASTVIKLIQLLRAFLCWNDCNGIGQMILICVSAARSQWLSRQRKTPSISQWIELIFDWFRSCDLIRNEWYQGCYEI